MDPTGSSLAWAPLCPSTLTGSTRAWKNPGIFPARPHFPYLDGNQGLFVIDVDEDVVPGREADVICNQSRA